MRRRNGHSHPTPAGAREEAGPARTDEQEAAPAAEPVPEAQLRDIPAEFSGESSDTLTLYLREVRSPEGKVHRWMIVERGQEVLAERGDFDLAFESAPNAASGYPIPARLSISGPGVAGEIALGRTLVQHDPLGDLPQPFRFLLSFEMRPRRVWTDSPFSLRLEAESGRSATALEGNGITSVTYLNPIR